MKAPILLALALTTLAASNAAQACTIMPKGDSQIRVNALHATIGDMEQLVGLTQLSYDTYELRVNEAGSDKVESRVYRIQNTSRMCPKYEATRIR